MRRSGLARLVVLMVVLGGVPATLGGCRGGGPDRHGAAAPRFLCPMHPAITSDRPGDCPICGMRLVPIEPTPPAGTQGEATPAPRTRPGPQTGPAEGEGAPAGPAVPGRTAIEVSHERRSAIGLRTEVVTRGPMTRRIRAACRVAVDERRIQHVHTKFEGWIEKLHVDFTGIPVRKGQLLFSIYSPEVLSAQEDYLIARRTAASLTSLSLPEAIVGSRDLVAAARRRLELLDVTDAQIRELEATGRPLRAIPMHAPASGIVLEKKAVAGLRVMPGEELFSIGDLSEVWILADIYEHEAPFVRVGQTARFRPSYGLDGERESRVDYVYPTVDPMTRTIRVRASLANPDLVLKPEMYGELVIETDPGERLQVSETALLHTGERQIAFVEVGGDRLEPREVRTGLSAGGRVEVLAGLEEGERVVVAANFLIDAESQLRAALAAMGGGR